MTQTNNGKLSGKIALVTGASSGIGEATALALAQEGAAVALVARRKERLDELAKQIQDAGGKATVIVSDLSEAGQASAVVAQTVSALGGLDIVVNNAGVMLLGPLAGGDPSGPRADDDAECHGADAAVAIGVARHEAAKERTYRQYLLGVGARGQPDQRWLQRQ